MAYNGSGVYVPPTGQPVVTGTVISSSVFNTLVTDIGNTFNNALPRDGQAGMTAQLKLVDGSTTAPGLTFNSEASTGFLRPSPGVLATTILGSEAMRVVTGGRVLVGTTTDDGSTRLQVSGNVSVSGNTTLTGNASVSGTLNVAGATTFTALTTGTLSVTGNSTLAGTLGVTGAATLNTFSSSNATITGGAINNTPIGATTPNTGNFTSINSTNAFNSVKATLSAASGYNGFQVADQSSNRKLELYYLGAAQGGAYGAPQGSAVINAAGTTGLTLSTNDTAALVISGSGNVGFGKTPNNRLDVNGSVAITQGSGTFRYVDGSNNFLADLNSLADGSLVFRSGGATERMRVDSNGNVGIGVVPSAWGSSYKALQNASGSLWGYSTSALGLVANAYDSGAGVWKYSNNGAALSLIANPSSGFQWNLASAGTAGAGVSFGQLMLLDTNGNLGVGTTPSTKLDVNVSGGMLRVGSGSGNNLIQAYSSGGTLGLWAGGSSQIYSNGSLALVTGATTSTSTPSAGTVAVSIAAGGAATFSQTMYGPQFVGNYTEAVRVTNDTGYVSFWNSANGTRTGYLQGNTGSDIRLVAENGNKLSFGTSGVAGRLVMDNNGMIGFLTTPSAWGTLSAIEGTGGALAFNGGASVYMLQNLYYNGSNWIYKNSGNGSLYLQNGGTHQWYYTASGSAGSSATTVQAMTLDASGNFLIGTGSATSSSSGRGLLEINGSANALLALDVGGARKGYIYHTGSGMIVNADVGAVTISTGGSSNGLTVNTNGSTTFAGGVATTPTSLGTTSGAVSFNATNSNVFRLTLNGNMTTLTTSGQQDGQTVNIFITQDSTGGRTLGALTNANGYTWPGGVAGVLSTAANAVDLLCMTWNNTMGKWMCTLSKGFA